MMIITDGSGVWERQVIHRLQYIHSVLLARISIFITPNHSFQI